MKQFITCRRTFIAALSILSLLILGLATSTDVSGPLASIAIGVAAANAGERALRKGDTENESK